MTLRSLHLFSLVLALPLADAQAQTAPLSDAQLLQQLDPDMAEVVLLFDAIKGTPIIDLTPQDARQQFSPEALQRSWPAASVLPRLRCP